MTEGATGPELDRVIDLGSRLVKGLWILGSAIAAGVVALLGGVAIAAWAISETKTEIRAGIKANGTAIVAVASDITEVKTVVVDQLAQRVQTLEAKIGREILPRTELELAEVKARLRHLETGKGK